MANNMNTSSIPNKLRKAIVDSWDAETSVTGKFDPKNPSRGQCVVTALIVQDHLGGELARSQLADESHYYNLLYTGQAVDDNDLPLIEVDLTRDQFKTYSPIETRRLRSRDELLMNSNTLRRYELLKDRVESRLKDKK